MHSTYYYWVITNTICEKTAGLRSGNFFDLDSACLKVLVPVKIFQFHDMLNENRFLGIFSGHGKRSVLDHIELTYTDVI